MVSKLGNVSNAVYFSIIHDSKCGPSGRPGYFLGGGPSSPLFVFLSVVSSTIVCLSCIVLSVILQFHCSAFIEVPVPR